MTYNVPVSASQYMKAHQVTIYVKESNKLHFGHRFNMRKAHNMNLNDFHCTFYNRM